MNFQPDCPMERGGLAVLALGDPLSLLPLVAASSPEGGSFIRADREMHKSSPFGGAGIA